MTVQVTMLQTRLGENGVLWLAGSTYAASDAFAAVLIGANLATGLLLNTAFSTAAESAGVNYNAAPAANAAAFNAALARRGLVTLYTPGQYLVGGPGQGGLLIPSNTTLICGHGVELIVADETFQPLLRNASAFEAGITLATAISYVSGAFGFRGRIDHAGIELVHPVGSWIAVGGLSGATAANRGYQGVYQVTAVATDQIFFNLLGVPPSGGNSAVGAVIRPADTNIRVFGGLWDGNDVGQTGDGYNDGDPRQFVNGFRNCHDLIVQGTQYRRGNSWAVGCNNIRNATFRGLSGDLYTDGGGTAVVLFQGAGAARNVLVEDVSGTCKDNLVAWSLDSMTGGTPPTSYPNYDQGDVYDLRFKKINGYNNQNALVAIWGNTNSRYHDLTIDGVTGRGNTAGVHLAAGYAPTNMLNINGGTLNIKNVRGGFNTSPVIIKTDGAWDHINIESIRNTSPNAGNQPVVKFERNAATQNIKRLDIRDVGHFVAGSTINRTAAAVDIRDSDITDLRIEGLPEMSLGANTSLVLFAGSLGTIKRAVVEKCAASASATGDSFVVSCENTSATAIGLLTARDNHFTAFDATGGIVRQSAAGKVTRIRSDGNTFTNSETATTAITRDGTGATLDVVSVSTT